MSHYKYDTREVEKLLPGVWDRDFVLEPFMGGKKGKQKDQDMPKGKNKDPRRTFDLIDGVIDVKQAWEKAGLTLKQQQALLVRYGLDETERTTAFILGIDQKSVQERIEGGLKKLVDYLNGAYRKPHPHWVNHPLHRSRRAA